MLRAVLRACVCGEASNLLCADASVCRVQAFYKEGPTGRPGMPRLALDIDATRMLVGAE